MRTLSGPRARAGAASSSSSSSSRPPRSRRLRLRPPATAAAAGVMAIPSVLVALLLLLSLPGKGAQAAWGSSSSSSEGGAAGTLAELKPFRVLGAWLDGSEASSLRGAGGGNIERAFKVVASSQAALKTMDGAAHGLYAYSKARPQTATRAWTRLEYSRATRAEKEARLKAFRKAKLLEEAVYSAELAELTAEGCGREEALAYVAGLQSPHEVLLEDFASVQGGRFRFLLLADRVGKRLTLSVGDAVGDWSEKLDVVRAPPLAVPLRSRGLLRRTMNANPRLWAAAVAVAGRVKPVLAAALRETHQGYDVHVVGFSLGAGVAAMVGGMLDGAIAPALPPPPPPPLAPSKAEGDDAAAGAGAGKGTGAAAGGDVGGAAAAPAAAAATEAAAAAARRRRAKRGRRVGGEEEGEEDGAPSPAALQALHGAIGMARDNVTTFVFAPPPCISKSVRGLHRFTTSFVMGDDMVPRANAASLGRLEKRLLDYVSEGGGGGGIYFDYARSWVKGVVGATLQQVVTHQVSRKDEEAEEENEGELTLPGRVYYIKPRKLHGGATIKEVLRGSLREDVLWQMHDIFVSKSMLKHHALDRYIGVLARVPVQ